MFAVAPVKIQSQLDYRYLPEMHGARPYGHCMFLQKISSCSRSMHAFEMVVQAR
jgi:hypothetical protein